MKQSEQARLKDVADGKRNEEKLVKGVRQDGHWPAGQRAPLADQGFDRVREGAPRADDQSIYTGQSAYGSLESAASSEPAVDTPDPTVEKRGGVSTYGNNLGSHYSSDQNHRPSQGIGTAPLSREHSAVGAAPESSDGGQYAGEYGASSAGPDATASELAVADAAQPAEVTVSGTASVDKAGSPGSARRRGDDQLKEEIHARLMKRPDVDIHDLSVALRSGHATLTGTVPDADSKAIIIELVDHVDGVLEIEDNITVQHVNPAQHATAQAYAVGGQVSDDLQHSGPSTFGAASAKASVLKQQSGGKKRITRHGKGAGQHDTLHAR